MTFKPRSLANFGSVPCGTNKQVTFYKYATTDAPAVLLTAGYFNDARDKLNVNDAIDAVCSAGGTGDRVNVLVTAVPASGDVTVAVNTDASGA